MCAPGGAALRMLSVRCAGSSPAGCTPSRTANRPRSWAGMFRGGCCVGVAPGPSSGRCGRIPGRRHAPAWWSTSLASLSTILSVRCWRDRDSRLRAAVAAMPVGADGKVAKATVEAAMRDVLGSLDEPA